MTKYFNADKNSALSSTLFLKLIGKQVCKIPHCGIFLPFNFFSTPPLCPLVIALARLPPPPLGSALPYQSPADNIWKEK